MSNKKNPNPNKKKKKKKTIEYFQKLYRAHKNTSVRWKVTTPSRKYFRYFLVTQKPLRKLTMRTLDKIIWLKTIREIVDQSRISGVRRRKKTKKFTHAVVITTYNLIKKKKKTS